MDPKLVRNILGIAAGYIAVTALSFFSSNFLFYVLGANASFDPGTFKVNTTWLILFMLSGLVASIIGGWVCMRIVKNQKVVTVLAGIVLILGLVLSIPELTESDAERNQLREGNVPTMIAMENAKLPRKALVINPFIAVIGIMIGAGIWKSSHSKHL